MPEKLGLVRGLAFAVAASSAFLALPAQASLIWNGDASGGTGIFGNLNCDSPGSITAVSDATQGLVWRYNKPSGSNRCENHGISVNGSRYVFGNNTTFYMGWRNRLSSLANNNANFQWKSYGSHIQNYPVLIKQISNKQTLQYRAPGESCCRTIWTGSPAANQWNHQVLAIHTGSTTTSGWIEFWFNNVQQTLAGGVTRYPGRTLDDINEPKWGIYGASDQSMSNHVDGLKVGTTYADVAQDGPPLPTPTPTPTVTPTVGPTATPTPTPTPPGAFIEITPTGSAVTASTSDANVATNVVDNNLGTRWSGNGDGTWLQLDLGTERTIAFVRVAVYQGNARRNRFDLQVSNGGGSWTTVQAVESSGTTTQEEQYDFGNVSARYVRYLGHGNIGSTNTSMNSVTEISIFTPNAPPTATPTPTSTPTPTATPTPPTGPVELTPAGSAVTASTNDGNLPANTVDDNLATRWSGNADGAWIQYDLGATHTVTWINVAWYQGNTRSSTFDVLASDLPTGPWTTLAAGRTSSGTTTAIESYDVTPGAGRHVRIVGHGNTLNGWNSLTEVQIFGIP